MFFSLVTFCAFTVPLYQQALCWDEVENNGRSATEMNVELYQEKELEKLLDILNSESSSTPSSPVTFAEDVYANLWKDFPTQPAGLNSIWTGNDNEEKIQSLLNDLNYKPTIEIITYNLPDFSRRRHVNFGLYILIRVSYIAFVLLVVGIVTAIKRCRDRKARAVGSDSDTAPLAIV